MVLNVHYIFFECQNGTYNYYNVLCVSPSSSFNRLVNTIVEAAGPLVAGGHREANQMLLWLAGIARRIELAGGHREANQIRPRSLVATVLSGYDTVL